MQSCNIATGAVRNYTNTIASVPTSEISRSGVGVSQQSPPRSTILRAASWRIGADSPRDSHDTTSASNTPTALRQHGQFRGNTATLLQLHETSRYTSTDPCNNHSNTLVRLPPAHHQHPWQTEQLHQTASTSKQSAMAASGLLAAGGSTAAGGHPPACITVAGNPATR